MGEQSLALQWRIARLKQLEPGKRADTLFYWVLSKSISMEQFREILQQLPMR